jgi:helicase required for RNAi-mediated heterochromatin assembly 1
MYHVYCPQKISNLQKEECLNQVLVTVVDNYQGEENEIILLSLVRSNEEERIGFLATENRVCVALSRARDGFFIVGNMDILAVKNPTWAAVKESLEKQEAIGPAIPVR